MFSAIDSTEAVLCILIAFLAVMAGLCTSEWMIERYRDRKAARYLRRLRELDAPVDRSKYATRNTVRGNK